MKGIIMAGGKGSRLDPATIACNKQFMIVYDKPLIYYSLTTLMLAGIREILLITTPRDRPMFQLLLKDGSQWGLSLTYAEEPEPRGIAAAFLIGREFIGSGSVCLILGDNIFYNPALGNMVAGAAQNKQGATIFGFYVQDPRRYGVVEFDKAGQVISLEEKPVQPKSHYAVPGLYFYDNQVVQIAGALQPSRRGELEITDVNCEYLARKELQVKLLEPGTAWLDAGTPDSLLQAGNFVYHLETCQGIKIACPEEAAYHQGWISRNQLEVLARQLEKTEYGQYLLRLAQ